MKVPDGRERCGPRKVAGLEAGAVSPTIDADWINAHAAANEHREPVLSDGVLRA